MCARSDGPQCWQWWLLWLLETWLRFRHDDTSRVNLLYNFSLVIWTAINVDISKPQPVWINLSLPETFSYCRKSSFPQSCRPIFQLKLLTAKKWDCGNEKYHVCVIESSPLSLSRLSIGSLCRLGVFFWPIHTFSHTTGLVGGIRAALGVSVVQQTMS